MIAQPSPVKVQQTVWTLIPRGTDAQNYGLFTAFVCPVVDPETATLPSIAQDTALSDTCWGDWYDRVSGVLATTNGSFLSVVSDTGLMLDVNVTGMFPQAPGAGN